MVGRTSKLPINPLRRLRLGNDLEGIVLRAAALCHLGAVDDYTVIDVGYEDCNVLVTSEAGRWVMKVFAAAREPWTAVRTVSLIRRAIDAGVAHPSLLEDRSGNFLHRDPVSGSDFLLMDYVDGSDFYSLGRAPTQTELALIIEEAIKIHSIDHIPAFVHDSWAIPNLVHLFGQVSDFLDDESRSRARRVSILLQGLDGRALQQRLVHGDMGKGNIMLTKTRRVAVLDFAVANGYPRIQELAVIAAILMYGDTTPLVDRADLLADLYSKQRQLGKTERKALRIYALAAATMALLGATYEKFVKGNRNSETEYMLSLGRTELLAAETDLRLRSAL